MMHESKLGVELFALLVELDGQMAREVAAERCRHCGGPLHQGNYLRKPRGGVLADAGEAFALRYSLCCGWRGCRRRALPPSLRFLGRRVYLEVVVLFASVMAQVCVALREARARTGVPRQTLRRWGIWWRETFPGLPMWTELRARFAPPPPDEVTLPDSLVRRIDADLAVMRGAAGAPTVDDVVLCAARFLAPATTSSVAAPSRFVRATM